MLKEDVIKSSESPWSSPVVLVKKKNGEWRFCMDYRRLNKVTKKDVYPLPRIDDALDCLVGARIFSIMDLKSGYWQVELDDKDREKTAFVTPDGLFDFKVMPFGLCSAPATFERMMDSVLGGLKWKSGKFSVLPRRHNRVCAEFPRTSSAFEETFDMHPRSRTISKLK
ncbi:Transposon Ty3-I Gag-Pol polyprotein [Araneus ventricosus]|uniref:Transposon Ty3-I Gag-Pol polyprotein n=1 Tax=Araneus ventricosus TaxID=182803 RepID=A0A4Y2LAJ2_ARAVE|nr:Transposon Ty3-I Gag-Pol polyprotein [Araneus ventricosus]